MKKCLLVVAALVWITTGCHKNSATTSVAVSKDKALQIEVLSSSITSDTQVIFSGLNMDPSTGEVSLNFSKVEPKNKAGFGIIKLNLKNLANSDLEIGTNDIALADPTQKNVEYLAKVNFRDHSALLRIRTHLPTPPGSAPVR